MLRRVSSILLGAGLLIGLVWGCASTSSEPKGAGVGSGGGPSDASNQGDRFVRLDGEMTDSGPLQLNPLCGVQSNGLACTAAGGDKDCPPAYPHCDLQTLHCIGCIPDGNAECLSYMPPSPGAQGGDGGQAGQSSGASSGAGGASSGAGGASSGAGGEAGASGEAGEAGATGQGGSTNDGGVDAGAPLYGCQVTAQGAEPVAACAPSGHGNVDAPCNNSGDCRAGLACVKNQNIPQCRPFCCQGDSRCGAGTYCAERALRDDRVAADAGAPLQVPVCVPADDCDLAAPYPCPAGAECVCKGATACMIVRSGTTACVVPGSGQELEPCPCAFGYVCSADADVCLKLCFVGGEQSCGAGLCQSVAGLPQGWGVCIGDTKPG